MRNRYRRKKLASDLREEIYPKNIIMIGSTGVGKTEIARRLAKMVKAPFIKVEASKFTEIGYVGRDVDSMIRDLLETSIRMVKQEKLEEVEDKAKAMAEERIVDYILPLPQKKKRIPNNPLELFLVRLPTVLRPWRKMNPDAGKFSSKGKYLNKKKIVWKWKMRSLR